MRLCTIANPNSVHVQRWIHYMAGRGHEIHLIAEHPPSTTPPLLSTIHDLTQHTNLPKLRYLAWAYQVRRIVRRLQPDILHAHQVTSAGWLGLAAGYQPFLVSAWGSDLLLAPKRSWLQRALARLVLRWAGYVTCVSRELAEAALALGAHPDRLEVVPLGIDTSLFQPPLHPPDPDAGTPVILSLRALRPIYNPLVVARAIPLVVEHVPDAQLVVRTYGAEAGILEQFRAIIAENGATAAVRYVGPLPDDTAIADQCRMAHVAVSVPSSDGTPLSVLEALACGAALVVSDLPSLREWVRHEQEALLVPVGDVPALGAAIVRLLRDPDLRRRLGENGARLVRARADQRELMARMEAIYGRLAGGPGGSGAT